MDDLWNILGVKMCLSIRINKIIIEFFMKGLVKVLITFGCYEIVGECEIGNSWFVI